MSVGGVGQFIGGGVSSSPESASLAARYFLIASSIRRAISMLNLISPRESTAPLQWVCGAGLACLVALESVVMQKRVAKTKTAELPVQPLRGGDDVP